LAGFPATTALPLLRVMRPPPAAELTVGWGHTDG
jgi:hypothetical protein